MKGYGEHIEYYERDIKVKDGKIVLHNDVLKLRDGAPEGIGTRIFANQVIEAKRAGIDRIECYAYRNDSEGWVGYKVWPKMGYDGSADNALSSSEELRSAVEKYYPDKDDIMVSDILSMPNGSDLWEKHGESFEATFDLKKDSASVKILREYLKRKAQKLNSTVESLVRVAKIHAL